MKGFCYIHKGMLRVELGFEETTVVVIRPMDFNEGNSCHNILRLIVV